MYDNHEKKKNKSNNYRKENQHKIPRYKKSGILVIFIKDPTGNYLRAVTIAAIRFTSFPSCHEREEMKKEIE